MILGEKKNTNKLQLFDHLLFFSPTLDVQIRTIIKQHFKPVQTKESRHQGKTGKRMRKIIKIKKLTSKWLSRYQEHAIFHPYVLLGPISKITNKKQFLSCRKDSNPVMYKNKKSGSSKSPKKNHRKPTKERQRSNPRMSFLGPSAWDEDRKFTSWWNYGILIM